MPTLEEIKIYEKVKRYYLKEDIKCRCEVESTEEELNQICDSIEHELTLNDGYLDSYWRTVENCIEDFYKED